MGREWLLRTRMRDGDGLEMWLVVIRQTKGCQYKRLVERRLCFLQYKEILPHGMTGELAQDQSCRTSMIDA